MLLYTDGFDAYPTADILKRWTGVANFADFTVQAAAGRNGTGCLQCGSIDNRRLQRLISAGGVATVYIGMAVKFSAIPAAGNSARFMALLASDGNYHLGLCLGGGGALELRSGGGTGQSGTLVASFAANINTGIFYYVEIQVTISNSIAANSCKVNLNGATVITPAAGTNLRPNTSISSVSFLEIGGQNGAGTNTVSWDDLYVCDSSGSTNNSLLGDIRVEAIRPTGAGSNTAWTPDTGSNYARVNEAAQDGDTSYVKTTVVGNVDTYAMGDLASNPSSILAVQVEILGRKDDAGNRAITSAVKSGSATYDHGGSNTYNLADGYTLFLDVWETDPATGLPWTGAGVNAMEAGVKLVG